MGFTLLGTTNLQIPLTPTFLVVLFSILAAISLVHALILRYHWKNYGNGALVFVLVNIIYFVGLSILLAGMGVFILAYGASH